MPYKQRLNQHSAYKKKYDETIRILREMKENKPCTDCGNFFAHYIMEYDHVPERGPKKCSVAAAVGRGPGTLTFINELAKCDLVCANCHATRTWMRKQNMPLSSTG
jgi:hypothetical protein